MTRRRIFWAGVAVIAAVLLAATVGWYWFSSRSLLPGQFLAHVIQLEQVADDPMARQSLGWSLAILGRDDEVRALDVFPQIAPAVSKIDFDQLVLHPVPWRDAVREIAARHRLVMMMEDHSVSKHREFIGATLPLLKDAGFTHYAAEAIGPSDQSLNQRGYPTNRTGLYTSDPQFGNTIRRALELKFTVLGYDFRPFTHNGREEFAATELAKVLSNDVDARLIVHAGHAHVLKTTTANGERWLAARLWEQTGLEPFTIWQWSSGIRNRDYTEIVRVLQSRGVALDEPVLLRPPPALDCGLQDSPFGLAAVDAIVIHPPDDSVAPDRRTVLFPAEMRQLSGEWTGGEWPVVVCAYQKGEPAEAIALDQVLLRDGETRFVLWIPHGRDEHIRVFNRRGEWPVRVHDEGGVCRVSRVER
jgi:hypothetical protein